MFLYLPRQHLPQRTPVSPIFLQLAQPFLAVILIPPSPSTPTSSFLVICLPSSICSSRGWCEVSDLLYPPCAIPLSTCHIFASCLLCIIVICRRIDVLGTYLLHIIVHISGTIIICLWSQFIFFVFLRETTCFCLSRALRVDVDLRSIHAY